MARIIAVDYGRKRVGIAASDPLQIIAAGIKTVASHEALDFIVNYVSEEDVECIVIGKPVKLNNEDPDVFIYIKQFVTALKRKLPGMRIEYMDERFTSKMARSAMLEGGMKKSERRNKDNVDRISAALILQSFLEKEKKAL